MTDDHAPSGAARHHPELIRELATSLGQEIGPADGGPVMAHPDDVARAVLFAISQPIELSIPEIAVQPAKRLSIQATSTAVLKGR